MELYQFKNIKLSKVWKTHPSYKKSNEFQRLEFMGDKIISFVITAHLMKNRSLTEGQLSVRLSALVNKDAIAFVGANLVRYILYSGKLTTAMICDCTEAYIAAIYMDGGDVNKVIYHMWQDLLNREFEPNYKNQLQELLQKNQIIPIYTYTESNKEFECILYTNPPSYVTRSIGRSKKEAAFKAASLLLKKLLIK